MEKEELAVGRIGIRAGAEGSAQKRHVDCKNGILLTCAWRSVGLGDPRLWHRKDSRLLSNVRSSSSSRQGRNKRIRRLAPRRAGGLCQGFCGRPEITWSFPSRQKSCRSFHMRARCPSARAVGCQQAESAVYPGEVLVDYPSAGAVGCRLAEPAVCPGEALVELPLRRGRWVANWRSRRCPLGRSWWFTHRRGRWVAHWRSRRCAQGRRWWVTHQWRRWIADWRSRWCTLGGSWWVTHRWRRWVADWRSRRCAQGRCWRVARPQRRSLPNRRRRWCQ